MFYAADLCTFHIQSTRQDCMPESTAMSSRTFNIENIVSLAMY